MSFDTRNGTRGARQPGAVVRWVNKLVVRQIRRKKGGGFGGMNTLVLNTIGSKSGAERATPVGWFPGKDGGWLIVASAAGAPRNPAWYYNLAAHPERVHIETGGQKTAVTAKELHGPQRDEAWRQIVSAAPRFAEYQEKTDRELPIIHLVPRSA
ncbi:hypothetical protein Rhe02_14190 [Rhizocola hellebori]|uniref:Nitroreductase family deazaflavin-dependent oxidoreductase n=1 Tax=Rhizocola hellebori TaxID=1392758 RepID=A0A8J3Q4U4_9ACTN|nr:nitroreductase/quinone reductase family protein [Rhizocola hellebori]GIH03352.1 hypothetical protein Rhe02_14190 [Rhizocola hellebori]